MNFIDGLVIGWILGIVSTFFGIMAFTRFMVKKQKKAYMEMGLDKLMGGEK